MRSSVVDSQPSNSTNGRRSDQAFPPNYRNSDSWRTLPRSSVPAPKLIAAPAEGWFSLLLLAIAAYSVVFSIMTANWVGHSFILLFSTAIGLLIGLSIAKIRQLPQAILHLAACLLGHWLSIWLTSVIAFRISWMLLLSNLRSALTSGITTGMSHGSDMVFLFYLCFLCFFLGYFGAWLIFRARLPWLVALVYCSIMLVTLNSINQDEPLLMTSLVGALLLLVARIQLSTQIDSWISEGLRTTSGWTRGLTWRFMQITSIFALIVLLLSWMLPILAEPAQGEAFWNSLGNAWTNITNAQFSLQNPGAIVQPYDPPANFFGDQLAITGNVSLPAGEVLYYTTTAPQSQPNYLEGFTYDNFDGHTWKSTNSDSSQNYAANDVLPVNTGASYTQVSTSVTVVKPPLGSKHYIFAPAQPESFDVSTTLYGNSIINAWTKQRPFTNGEHYLATSLVLASTAQDFSALPPLSEIQFMLQNGNDFPDLRAYLQIPSLPPAILQTAKLWTSNATNAYDAMKLLEGHLSDKTQFYYSISNPPVPGNVDAVSWLLHTHHGYCTYYATAMTIMARLLGMPARIVSGFSQGHYDRQHKAWIVNGDDAHSWVQVYFPNFGWVSFDPTPGYSLANTNSPAPTASPIPTSAPTHPTPTPPATSQPHPRPTQHPGGQATASHPPSPDAIARQHFFAFLSLAILLFSIVVLLLAICTYWWRNLYTNTSFVSGMYWRMIRLVSLVGLPPQKWQTPYEYSKALSRHLPQEMAPMKRLTNLFVYDRWAPHGTSHPVKEGEVEHLWPHLRQMLLQLFLLKFQSKK